MNLIYFYEHCKKYVDVKKDEGSHPLGKMEFIRCKECGMVLSADAIIDNVHKNLIYFMPR